MQKPARYALVDLIHHEIYTANHQTIGEAFNHAAEGFVNNQNIVIVKHIGDKIVGRVNRNGSLTKKQPALPQTIWSGPKHPYLSDEMAKQIEEGAKARKALKINQPKPVWM